MNTGDFIVPYTASGKAPPGSARFARRSLAATIFAVVSLGVIMAGGCSSKPALTHSGFLSDYSMLEPVTNSRLRYESPRARDYNRFIMEPVQVEMQRDVLSEADRAEAIRHFNTKLREAVQSSGHTTVTAPGPGVARVRVALTGVAKSTWWKKIYPAARVAGAGTGGAAMEAEVIDSITGEQIAAVIQAGSGNQFDFTAFSTLADVKSAIDKWSATFAERLKELRGESR